ncbi:Holliday junction resolvase RuvX [Candidatus Marinimicrobia bacterium]|nr:Holliday junction resolvase RuvX [Candidatus Neomarinimicrobiota bacterium]
MGRCIGIDLGTKRVGLALSDSLNIIASPFKTLTFIDNNDLVSKLSDIINDNNVKTIILGLPLNMSGVDTEQTKKVRTFKASLAKLNIPILYEDERLSSVSAKKSLVMQNVKTGHNKAEIDRTAAAIILQQFLDKKV